MQLSLIYMYCSANNTYKQRKYAFVTYSYVFSYVLHTANDFVISVQESVHFQHTAFKISHM